jgi:hypothetical protein
MTFKDHFYSQSFSDSIDQLIEGLDHYLNSTPLVENTQCDLKEKDLTPEQKKFVVDVAKAYAKSQAWDTIGHTESPSVKSAIQVDPATGRSNHPYALNAKKEFQSVMDRAISEFGDCGYDLFTLGTQKVGEYFSTEKNEIQELIRRWVRSPQNPSNTESLKGFMGQFGAEHGMEMYNKNLKKMYGTA